MARTINGKCTGMAAKIEKRAIREQAQWEDALWLEEYNRVAKELIDIDPNCEDWFWSRPEATKGEMFPLMVERLEVMQREADNQDLRDTNRSIVSEFLPY